MDSAKRIAKNAIVTLISQVIGLGLGFIYLMYTARYLGAEGFGLISFALAFTGISSTFLDLGLCTLAIREVARDKLQAQKYLGNIISIKILLSALMALVVLFFVCISGYSQDKTIVLLLIFASSIFNSFTIIFNSVFQAYERMEYNSLGVILYNVIMVATALIMVYLKYDITAFAAINFIANLLVMLYSLLICSFLFVKPGLSLERSFISQMLKSGIPFAITGISINAYLWINSILLSIIKGEEAVGWYNASFRLVVMLLFIPVAFNAALFPIMSQHYLIPGDSLKRSFEKLFKITLYVGLPLSVIIFFYAGRIIRFIYGNGFGQSIAILSILSLSVALIYFRSPLERLLEASNRQSIVSNIFISCAVFNIIVNIILIQLFSATGAAIATVVTDLLILLLLIISIDRAKIIAYHEVSRNSSKIIVSGIVMSLYIILFSSLLNEIILFISAVILYLILTISLNIVSSDDVSLIKSIIRREGKNEMQNMP